MCSYSNWKRGQVERLVVAGSTPAERTQALSTASLAQSAAQPPSKRKVPGSGPGGGSL